MTLKLCAVLLAVTAVSLAQFPPSEQPSYGGPRVTYNFAINNVREREGITTSIRNAIYEEENYEWEGYDGWYNNPAHPEWGGAGECTQIKIRRDQELSIWFFFLFPALSAMVCVKLFVSRCRYAYGEEDTSSLPGWSVRDRWR